MKMTKNILATSQAELANPANVANNLGETLEASNVSSQANVNLL